MLKLADNPPIIAPSLRELGHASGQWWIAHTKARFEKAFAFDLLRRGTGYFLPLINRIKMSGGRKRHVMLPLFPSYVFFCGTPEDRYAALATNRLCRVIETPDQSGLLGELRALELALTHKAVLDLYPFAAIGRRCRVRTGPFEGIEGVVIERGGPTRLVLQVKMLGQGAVDGDRCRPARAGRLTLHGASLASIVGGTGSGSSDVFSAPGGVAACEPAGMCQRSTVRGGRSASR